MKTNAMNILIVLVMAIVLASCGEHSLDDLIGEKSSSSEATGDKPSSSSKKSSSSGTKTSSSSNNIVINDRDIEPAASFASETFDFISFPFYISSWGNEYWFSMSGNEQEEYGKWYDLNRITQDGQGDACNSLIKRLYSNRTEFLSNGKLKRYIELLAGFVPRKTYVENGWDAMVNQLLAAYEDLAATNSFSGVYEFMGRYDNSIDYYPEILGFVSEGLDDVFFIKQGDEVEYCCRVGEVNRWAVVWAYSFWGRRYNEDPDSIESIVDILLMLRDKYK